MYGFENIFTDKYSTYINPTPIAEYRYEDMSGATPDDDGKLVRYIGETRTQEPKYIKGAFYRYAKSSDTWNFEEQEKVYINGIYDTKCHAFANVKLSDGSVLKWGDVGNQLTDIAAYGDTPFPKLYDDDTDSNPNRIINTKYVDIEFHNDSADIELVKYYDVALVHYIQQLLPSTIIASIRFGRYRDCGIGCMMVPYIVPIHEDDFLVR
jgi:hypothetical protein